MFFMLDHCVFMPLSVPAVGGTRVGDVYKIKKNYSCEIEAFVETRLLRAVCDAAIARTAAVRVLNGLIRETQSVCEEDQKLKLQNSRSGVWSTTTVAARVGGTPPPAQRGRSKPLRKH